MDSIGQTNGNGHHNGNGHTDGNVDTSAGLQQAIALAREDMSDDFRAVNIQHGNFGSKQRDVMDKLERLAERVERHYASQIEGLRHQLAAAEEQQQESRQQLNALQQELMNLQDFVRGIPDQIKAAHDLARAADRQNQIVQQQCQVLEQQLQDIERRAGETTQQIATHSSALEEESRRRGNVEVSIGELAQEVATIRSADVAAIKKDVGTLQDILARSGARMRKLAAAATAVIILGGFAGTYVLAWPMVSHYVIAWLP